LYPFHDHPPNSSFPKANSQNASISSRSWRRFDSDIVWTVSVISHSGTASTEVGSPLDRRRPSGHFEHRRPPFVGPGQYAVGSFVAVATEQILSRFDSVRSRVHRWPR
jgi:hypothetical protein